MLYITRKFQFSASHKVHNPAWSDEENLRVYGKCANPNGHGHNYTLEVTVAGENDASTGFVMDLKELSRLMKTEIIDKVDHTFLNEDVPFLQGKFPSTEVFAVEIWKILAPVIKDKYNNTLHCIKLIETPNHYVEYFGD